MPRKRRAAATDATESRSSPPAQKRTRFASPEDDSAEFSQQVEEALEDPRKGRVNAAEYDSDSTDDGEGVVESRKIRNKESDDDDDDMFMHHDYDPSDMGHLTKQEQQKQLRAMEAEGEYSMKDELFGDRKASLKLGDIEGQEFGEEKGEGDELSDESNEPEDEDDAERRKKAGMGYELSSFNLREEMEEGKFDADGTFIRTYDAHAVHDRWMEGLDEKAIKKARKQKKLRDRQEREREEREAREAISKENAEMDLVPYLEKGETVLEALQRLGTVAKKTKAKVKQRQSKHAPNSTDVDMSAANNVAHAISPIQEAIARITDLASILMGHGNIDIYNTTYEQLLRSIRSKGQVDADWVPPTQELHYEFRWAVEGTGSEKIYGPYTREDIQAWYKAHYFGDDGEKVRIRKVGDNNWHEWDEVIF